MTKAEEVLGLFEEKPLKDPKVEKMKLVPNMVTQKMRAKCIECYHEFDFEVGKTDYLKCPKCGADIKIAE